LKDIPIYIQENMNPISIGNWKIGDGEPCFIIAEAGVNHNGDLALAKRLIDAAADAGSDAVKFQTFHAENIVTSKAVKADYQKVTTSSEESQYKMLKKLELAESIFFDLAEYASQKQILFLSTPFDTESVDLLDDVGVPAFKIPSGEITNFPLLKKIARKNKPVILSTGMSTLGEVEAAFFYLKKEGAQSLILLHCTTCYPAPVASINLRAMESLRHAFHVPVGYSDHSEGITIPIAAAAMGACIIEKHFTLDRGFEGPDHKASLEPLELKAMVQGIRDVGLALGDGVKRPAPDEERNKEIIRKSLVAAKDIAMGETITEDMLCIKRPGTGINPVDYSRVLGTISLRAIGKDEVITLSDIRF
jgi:N-acetylneuraminate synthase